MKKRTILICATVVGVGAAAALVPATAALAGPNGVKGITTQTVIATTTAPADDTAEAEATCANGTLLVGGGYKVNGASTDWRVYVDAPLNGTTWLVEPVNFAAQPLTFSAYAICAASVPGKQGVTPYTTHVVQAQVDVPANQTGEADATCPAGQLRTGGGYDVVNVSDNWSIYSNSPLNADTWNVEIDNEVPLSTTFDSYAVCLARTNAKPVTALAVSSISTPATAPANSVQTADVACGANALMTGGGHAIASIGPFWSIQVSAPVSNNDWRVKVSDLDSFSRDFDSTAVCLAKA